MTTDNGNGMKYVGLIILASIGLFVAGIFLSYVADDLRLPAWPDWEPSARAWALGSALLLTLLTLLGAGA